MSRKKGQFMRKEKQKICDKLAETIKMTYRGNDLVGLILNEKETYVTAEFIDGRTKRIYIDTNSGLAMIYDIVMTLYVEILRSQCEYVVQ